MSSGRPTTRGRFARNAKVRLWPTRVVLQARRPLARPRQCDADAHAWPPWHSRCNAGCHARCRLSPSAKFETRIHAIDERLARLHARRDRLLARAGQAERKRDTRRKTVIGGAVIAAIDHEGVPPMQSTIELRRWLDARLARPHDREVFGLDAGERATEQGIRPSERTTRSDTAVKDAGPRPAPRSGVPRP